MPCCADVATSRTRGGQLNSLGEERERGKGVTHTKPFSALVRHEASLTAERRTRQDNLRTAAEAQQRALELLEQQDKLITDTTHFNVWRLLQLENPVTP